MTTENIFSAVLTLSLMAGGVLAFGSDAASKPAPAKAETIAVTLPTVTVVGRRAPATIAAAERVTLPTVMVVGRRVPARVAVETETVEHRVQ